MDKETKDRILDSAADNYGGDVAVAIAAELMGDIVITAAGGQIPAGADYPRIAELHEEITGKAPVLDNASSSDLPVNEEGDRPDGLNEGTPAGDPERPDDLNDLSLDAEDPAAADPERRDALNRRMPVGDPERPDRLNAKGPSGDPARPDSLNTDERPESDRPDLAPPEKAVTTARKKGRLLGVPKPAAKSPRKRTVSRMNKTELLAEAGKRGIDVSAAKTAEGIRKLILSA